MAQINFPVATAAGQIFEADTGVLYTYVGTPPNGYWSGTFGSEGTDTLDARYVKKQDGGVPQTIASTGLKISDNNSDTIVLEGNGSITAAGNISKNTAAGSLVAYQGDTYWRLYNLPTTINDYKISLNTDGSATFAGDVLANNGVGVDGGASLSTGLYYRDDSESYGIALYSGGSAQPNRKVFIKTDGSGTFKGDITADGAATFAGVCTVGDRVVCNKDGANSNTQTSFISYKEDGATAGVSFTAGGSATFAGDVQVAGNPAGGAAQGVKSYVSGYIRAANTNDTYSVFEGFKVGTSTPTSKISVNGSASFNSRLSLALAAPIVDIGLSVGYTSATKIYNNGNAEFKGEVTVGDQTTVDYTKLYSNGGIRCYRAASDSEGFALYDPSGAKVQLYMDGSATFKGNVVSGNAWADNDEGAIRLRASANGKNASVDVKGDTNAIGCFTIRSGGSALADAVVQIDGDGSAEFAGDTVVGPNKAGQSGNNSSSVYLGKEGYVSIYKPNTATSAFINCRKYGVTDPVFKVDDDGSATFAGPVVGKGAGPAYAFEVTDGTTNMGGLYRDANGNNLYIKDSSGSTKCRLLSSGEAFFENNSASGETPPLKLTQHNADGNFLTCKNGSTNGNTIQFGVTGTASFKGPVSVTRASDTQSCFEGYRNGTAGTTSKITAQGAAEFNGYVASNTSFYVSAAADDQACFMAKRGGVNKITLFANGNATFAGAVSASNITAFKSRMATAVTAATTLATLKQAILDAIGDL